MHTKRQQSPTTTLTLHNKHLTLPLHEVRRPPTARLYRPTVPPLQAVLPHTLLLTPRTHKPPRIIRPPIPLTPTRPRPLMGLPRTLATDNKPASNAICSKKTKKLKPIIKFAHIFRRFLLFVCCWYDNRGKISTPPKRIKLFEVLVRAIVRLVRLVLVFVAFDWSTIFPIKHSGGANVIGLSRVVHSRK